MFDERGLCDHAYPQLRALIGVWTFEGDEVRLAQLGACVVAASDFVGDSGLSASLQQQGPHTAVA